LALFFSRETTYQQIIFQKKRKIFLEIFLENVAFAGKRECVFPVQAKILALKK
jgi:hypothetical protein